MFHRMRLMILRPSGLALLLLSALAQPLAARPLPYVLAPEGSEVAFEIGVGQNPLRGVMPVSRADLTLDFDHAAASRIDVTLDVAGARMALPFATQAMKGAEVLDAARFPEIRFQSLRLRADGSTATVDGNLTIRGVTRPITLAAQIFRPKGSADGDRSALIVRLQGTVSRSAFGASGFADMVGDQVRLDIRAHILLAP